MGALRLLVVLFAVCAVGCGDSDPPQNLDGGQDAGQHPPDAGNPDAGGPDAGSPDAGSDGGVDAGTFTLHGQLIDKYQNPSTGLVILDGQIDQAVTVGADGQFTLDGVTAPYDLAVYTGTRLIDLRGVSTATPTVLTDTAGASRWLSLSGQITNLPGPLPADESIFLSLTGVATALPVNSDGTFSTSLSWFVPGDTFQSDLVALHVVKGATPSFVGSGKLTGLTWNPGTHLTGLNFPADTAVSTQSTTVQVTSGAYPLSQFLRLRDVTVGGATFSLYETVPNGATFAVPSEGARLMVQGQDASHDQASIIQSAVLGGTTALVLPQTVALRPLTPADGATGVARGPTLTWTPVEASLIELRVQDTANANALVYDAFLPGDTSQFTLLSAPAQGVGLLANHTYAWTVYAWDRTGYTPDGVASNGAGGDLWRFTPVDGAVEYQTGSRTLTTAP